MNTQLHSITEQMAPLMEHYVVHPKASQTQANAHHIAQISPPALHREQIWQRT